MIEIYDNDSDKIIFAKMFIAVLTLLITSYSIISQCFLMLKNRKKKMGFRKDD